MESEDSNQWRQYLLSEMILIVRLQLGLCIRQIILKILTS
jgi:hypothetical protein